MKLLNIYGQESWHTEARIVGNEEGLLELREAIDKAIKTSKARTMMLFASNGEGYEVIIECHNDKWGLEGSSDSFWNKEESFPQYISLILLDVL